MNRTLSLSDPVLGDDEISALKEVIDSGWITMGDKVRRFEKSFARRHANEDAVAVTSGTAALHLAMAALGITEGDEVLVPSLTFVATANVVWYAGAKPVLVDIENVEHPHLAVSDARDKLSSRTKAVMVVHYGGWLADMEIWRAFADEHQLLLIEDASHAPGLSGVAVQGDVSAFSFYGNKNITTAEGGMVLSRHPEVRERVRNLRSHGMTTVTLDRHAGHAYSYDVIDLGFNYRMDELRAAIGIVQLAGLNRWNSKRRRLLDRYRERIEEAGHELRLPFTGKTDTTAHICPVLLPLKTDRDTVMKSLRTAGVHSSVHYPPIHRFSYYTQRLGLQNIPKTEEFAERELSLPIHPGMSSDDVDYVVSALLKVL